jgi:hypothetical protein
MARFRKNPVVIEAVKWNGKTFSENPEWIVRALLTPTHLQGSIRPGMAATGQHSEFLDIGTLEGLKKASPGDWIIRGVTGELYSCKPDIFDLEYEAMNGEPPSNAS